MTTLNECFVVIANRCLAELGITERVQKVVGNFRGNPILKGNHRSVYWLEIERGSVGNRYFARRLLRCSTNAQGMLRCQAGSEEVLGKVLMLWNGDEAVLVPSWRIWGGLHGSKQARALRQYLRFDRQRLDESQELPELSSFMGEAITPAEVAGAQLPYGRQMVLDDGTVGVRCRAGKSWQLFRWDEASSSFLPNGSSTSRLAA